MGSSVTESARQSIIIMKNEIKKYFSGKRMYVFLALMGALVFILAVIPPILGKDGDPIYFYMLSSLVVLMASTLFASISIVSEYEERTALIILTRPIRKTSIFIGKALAAYLISLAFMALYYLVAAIVSLCFKQSVSIDLLVSFGYACVYAFATTGIAMTVSAFMKKSSTATIITFVILAVIFLALSTVLGIADVETDWLLDQCSNSICTSSSEYRDYSNKMMSDLLQMLAYPGAFVDFDKFAVVLNILLERTDVTADMLNGVMSDPNYGIWNMSTLQKYIGSTFVEAPDGPHDVLCMIAWGVAGFIAAFLKFCRREF